MYKRTALQILHADFFHLLGEVLTVVDRFKLEESIHNARQINTPYFNKIKTAIRSPQTLCDPEIQQLVVDYIPFTKGRLKTSLESYVTSQIQLLDNQPQHLFDLLKQTQITDDQHHRITEHLSRNPILVKAEDDDGKTPLLVVTKGGPIGLARLLLDKGAEVTSTSKRFSNSLHIAAILDKIDVAALLIEHAGALGKTTLVELVNAKNNFSNTPLHFAASFGYLRMVQLIIKADADINSLNRWDETPLHRALEQNRTEVAEALIGNGADVTIPFSKGQFKGRTPLDILRSKGQETTF